MAQQDFNIPLVADVGGTTEWRLVRPTAGKRAAIANATAPIIGVSQFTTSAGNTATIQVNGVAQVRIGGVVAVGDPITSDAAGQGITAAPAAGVNAFIVGYALQAGVANDVIDVLLTQSRIQG